MENIQLHTQMCLEKQNGTNGASESDNSQQKRGQNPINGGSRTPENTALHTGRLQPGTERKFLQFHKLISSSCPGPHTALHKSGNRYNISRM